MVVLRVLRQLRVMDTAHAPKAPASTDVATSDPPPGAVLLRWTFTPADYFEQTVDVVRPDYRMTIGSGVVEASVEEATFDGTPDMRKKVHEELNARFLAAQLLKHRPYELSGALVVREGGRREFNLDATSGKYTMVLMQGRMDVLAFDDATGKVIIDTKRDRLEREKAFMELIARHIGNVIVQAMLKSHRKSMDDPATHLYEIREALRSELGGDGKGSNERAFTALGFSEDKWNRLGEITCGLPLNQSRHRGNFVGALRDATQAELDEARAIAREMIEAYLRWLP